MAGGGGLTLALVGLEKRLELIDLLLVIGRLLVLLLFVGAKLYFDVCQLIHVGLLALVLALEFELRLIHNLVLYIQVIPSAEFLVLQQILRVDFLELLLGLVVA